MRDYHHLHYLHFVLCLAVLIMLCDSKGINLRRCCSNDSTLSFCISINYKDKLYFHIMKLDIKRLIISFWKCKESLHL